MNIFFLLLIAHDDCLTNLKLINMAYTVELFFFATLAIQPGYVIVELICL